MDTNAGHHHHHEHPHQHPPPVHPPLQQHNPGWMDSRLIDAMKETDEARRAPHPRIPCPLPSP